MTKNEESIDVEEYNESLGGLDVDTEETLTAMMEDYLSGLEDYFNDENEEVFNYTGPSSENGEIIIGNKESGSFSDHKNHNIEVLNMEEENSVYHVTVAKIGRASCRERGYVAVVGGTINIKRRKE